MARAEISALFNLKWVTDRPVTSARIGSGGVSIGTIDAHWLLEIKKQCPKIEAREQIEWTHLLIRLAFRRVMSAEQFTPTS